MRYLLAFFAPPFAVLACRKPVQFVLNLIFWLVSIPLLFLLGFGIVGWAICTVHAMVVCVTSSADRRLDRVVAAIEARSNQPAA